MAGSSDWVEIGDRVFVRRYTFYDQNIGVVLGRGEVLVIDTRSTYRQAREILDDLRSLTRDPVTVVVDTHGHFDHAYGNAVFRPATIWGHAGCVTFLERTGEQRKASIKRSEPDLAPDIDEVRIDPPDRTFIDTARIEVGGRTVTLRFLGRGHTDHDAVVTVDGTGVVWAGDLFENGALPYFGDGFPIDWPATAATLAALVDPAKGVVVPGHGDHADRAFADRQARSFGALAGLARRVQAGEITIDDAVSAHPFPECVAEDARRPIERAVQQLRGDLD